MLIAHPQVTSKPQVIDEVDRRLIQLEMEKLSLRKETRRDALQRVEQIDQEVEELTAKQVRKQAMVDCGALLHLGSIFS